MVVILGLLGLLGIIYIYVFIKDLVINKNNLGTESYPIAFVIGIITNFLDTLGIGSFAVTTLGFKVTRFLKSDKLLPGTLNVSHTIPILLQAFIFINVIEVDLVTLVSMCLAATLGAWFGAKKVAKVKEKNIQFIMGAALIVTALIMIAREVGLISLLGQGNEATGLYGARLIFALMCNFILGILMTAGVGLYAPCMALIYMLGLNPLVAFPIMMGSCASLMPVASAEFIKSGNYSRKGAIGICLGGIIGVLAAVYLVTNINLTTLIWIIISVVIFTGISMIIKALKSDNTI